MHDQVNNVAVYIGAGLDVRPIRALAHIDRFIYIDSRPSTQQPTFDIQHKQYDKRFVREFCRKLEALDFEWSFTPTTNDSMCCFKKQYHNAPFAIEFENNRRSVVYHMNTTFPFSHDAQVRDEISKANTLIIAGFHPHKSILDLMQKPVQVVCWEGTWYGDEEYDDCKDSIVAHMHTDMSDVGSITYYKKEYIPQTYKTLRDVEFARKNSIKHHKKIE
jgi:hypothetical protein